mmetsp:Transcript_9129/g.30023  ORF Transcript_9129/g.30023 Transcript_9129/m.30023 type:complete len:418 (-) Transcript_9129:127-1380(-)
MHDDGGLLPGVVPRFNLREEELGKLLDSNLSASVRVDVGPKPPQLLRRHLNLEHRQRLLKFFVVEAARPVEVDDGEGVRDALLVHPARHERLPEARDEREAVALGPDVDKVVAENGERHREEEHAEEHRKDVDHLAERAVRVDVAVPDRRHRHKDEPDGVRDGHEGAIHSRPLQRGSHLFHVVHHDAEGGGGHHEKEEGHREGGERLLNGSRERDGALELPEELEQPHDAHRLEHLGELRARQKLDPERNHGEDVDVKVDVHRNRLERIVLNGAPNPQLDGEHRRDDELVREPVHSVRIAVPLHGGDHHQNDGEQDERGQKDRNQSRPVTRIRIVQQSVELLPLVELCRILHQERAVDLLQLQLPLRQRLVQVILHLRTRLTGRRRTVAALHPGQLLLCFLWIILLPGARRRRLCRH